MERRSRPGIWQLEVTRRKRTGELAFRERWLSHSREGAFWPVTTLFVSVTYYSKCSKLVFVVQVFCRTNTNLLHEPHLCKRAKMRLFRRDTHRSDPIFLLERLVEGMMSLHAAKTLLTHHINGHIRSIPTQRSNSFAHCRLVIECLASCF